MMTGLKINKKYFLVCVYFLVLGIWFLIQNKLNFLFSAAKNLNLILIGLLLVFISALFIFAKQKQGEEKAEEKITNKSYHYIFYGFLYFSCVLCFCDFLIKYFASCPEIIFYCLALITIPFLGLFFLEKIDFIRKNIRSVLAIIYSLFLAVVVLNPQLSYMRFFLIIFVLFLSSFFSFFELVKISKDSKDTKKLSLCLFCSFLMCFFVFYFSLQEKGFLLLGLLPFFPIKEFNKQEFIKHFKTGILIFLLLFVVLLFAKNGNPRQVFYYKAIIVSLLGAFFIFKNNKNLYFVGLCLFLLFFLASKDIENKDQGIKTKTLFSKSSIFEDLRIIQKKDSLNERIVSLSQNGINKDVQLFVDRIDKNKAILKSKANPLSIYFDSMGEKTRDWKFLQIGISTGFVSCSSRLSQDWEIVEVSKVLSQEISSANSFTYLENCLPNIRIKSTNPRQYLRLKDKKYDVIIIDGIKGANVNPYLYTKEAFELYEARLKKQGVILFNVAHPFLYLKETVLSSAINSNFFAVYLHSSFSGKRTKVAFPTYEWLIASKRVENFSKIAKRIKLRVITKADKDKAWHDNNIKIFSSLKPIKNQEIYQQINIFD